MCDFVLARSSLNYSDLSLQLNPRQLKIFYRNSNTNNSILDKFIDYQIFIKDLRSKRIHLEKDLLEMNRLMPGQSIRSD
ncbi:hypothetical protein BpHYR1_023207 [Brachionus plicatilis]|uniref:Uncharacterized protein n=1 Tax=Brachionus plicatilis TaxID=10195 RepID=A0A3M7PUC9_BRAPC|nr:hypothetical protein BpHYR1_023207 [Brachionus plicatilis]